jgi:hypothetical protein
MMGAGVMRMLEFGARNDFGGIPLDSFSSLFLLLPPEFSPRYLT